MFLKITFLASILICQSLLTNAIFKKFSRPIVLTRRGELIALHSNESEHVFRDPVFTPESAFIPTDSVGPIAPITPINPFNPFKIFKSKSRNSTENLQKNSNIEPYSCEAVMGKRGSPGVYLINVTNSNLEPFFVYCERDPKGGSPWTIIQRRVNGLINFNRDWSEYREGFGHIESNFWLGLKRIHALTTAVHHELWIEMQDWSNISFTAKYSSFAVGDENQLFALNVLGSYSGNAGDSLLAHAGQKFSTINRDNDNFPDASCAKQFRGGWWFRACYKSFLNGLYVNEDQATVQDGIKWNSLHGDDYSLHFAQMAIRPK